jgi:hypothetical protein
MGLGRRPNPLRAEAIWCSFRGMSGFAVCPGTALLPRLNDLLGPIRKSAKGLPVGELFHQLFYWFRQNSVCRQ